MRNKLMSTGIAFLLIFSIVFISGCTTTDGSDNDVPTNNETSMENYNEIDELGNEIRNEIQIKLDEIQ